MSSPSPRSTRPTSTSADAIRSGSGSRPDGTFTINDLPPARYRIFVLEALADGNREVASAEVVVPPGAAASVDLVYEEP